MLPRGAGLEISCDTGQDVVAVLTAAGEVVTLDLSVAQVGEAICVCVLSRAEQPALL